MAHNVVIPACAHSSDVSCSGRLSRDMPGSAESVTSSLPTTLPAGLSHDDLIMAHGRLLECITVLSRHLEADTERPTPFHSSVVPPVKLAAYALRISHHSGYGADGLAMGLALMGRYAKATRCAPSPLTAHRLLATCIVVGMKATCDKFVKNVYMAPITGVPLEELNWLEATLLDTLGFCAIPTASELYHIPREIFALDGAAEYRPGALFAALTCAGPQPELPCAALQVSPFGHAPPSPTMSFSSSAAFTPTP